MRRWRFEFRQTFSWGHAIGVIAVFVVFLPGLLRGSGLSYFMLLRYLELLFPLVAALLVVTVFAPETQGMVVERVATTVGGFKSVFMMRFALLAGYVGAVIFVTAGLTLAHLARLEQLSAIFIVALTPSLGFMALTAYALVCTGSVSTALATLSVIWGAMTMLSAFASVPLAKYSSPFGYFAGYPDLTMWIGKAFWGALALLFLVLSMRRLKYPYRLINEL